MRDIWHLGCTDCDITLVRTQVQRYLSLRTVGEAKKACLLTMITMASLIIMVSMFASYQKY